MNLDLKLKDINYLNAVFTKPTAQEEVFFPLTGMICVQYNITISTIKFTNLLLWQCSLGISINSPYLKI